MDFQTWKTGGVRQVGLESAVPAFLAPSRLDAFFVATEKRRVFPVSSLNPFVLFRREYVVAVTDSSLVVLRLKLPAIFRAAVAGIEEEHGRESLRYDWDGRKFQVDGNDYFPIPFHQEYAERTVAALQDPLAT